MSKRGASTVLDEYLVVRCQDGDSEALELLVQRWHPRLLRQAVRYTRDAEVARDVVQECWLAIVRGLGSLRDPARFRAWAQRVVANKARDWVRRQQSRRRLAERSESARQNAEETAFRVDAVRRVRAGLQELDPDRRLILRWFYLEEMSVREIAEAMSIPPGTVKSRLFHARKALRQRLEEK